MLVLSRTDGQRLMIGEDIVITVLGYRRGKIKIGVEAPEGVSVHREEIFNKRKDSGPDNCREDVNTD
jgi:carbon storage regulator